MSRLPAYLVLTGALVAFHAAVAESKPAAGGRSTAVPAGDAEAGRELYVESCRACHSGAIAPALKGIVNRPIAAAPGYSFSAGLKAKAGKTWTAAELNAFMADPKTYAPGTKMMKAVPDAQERADIIAYLQEL